MQRRLTTSRARCSAITNSRAPKARRCAWCACSSRARSPSRCSGKTTPRRAHRRSSASTKRVCSKAAFPHRRPVVPYRLRVRFPVDHEVVKHDTYFFSHELSDFDLYLFGEGRHYGLYHKFGAHPRVRDGVAGTALRRLGAECQARERGRQLQPLGRAQARHAGARRLGRLGAVRARASARARNTNTRSARSATTSCSSPIPSASACSGGRRPRRSSPRSTATNGTTPPGCSERAQHATGAARRSMSTKCTCRAGSTPGIASRRSSPGPKPPSA